jgi:hypothetical protein
MRTKRYILLLGPFANRGETVPLEDARKGRPGRGCALRGLVFVPDQFDLGGSSVSR